MEMKINMIAMTVVMVMVMMVVMVMAWMRMLNLDDVCGDD